MTAMKDARKDGMTFSGGSLELRASIKINNKETINITYDSVKNAFYRIINLMDTYLPKIV